MLLVEKNEKKTCPIYETNQSLLNYFFSDCGDPRQGNPDLLHSELFGETLFDGTAFFQCDTGYVGGGAATCQDDGTWGTLPNCSPKGNYSVHFSQT